MAAANKAPPYPKQKYTDSKFREIIPLLSLNEYLKVEYLAKGVWFKMLSKRVNSYNCECCGVDNVGPTPITDHVRGKKHRFALQTAERLYHPNYTAPKNSNAPARTPILDAYNGAAGANPTAKQMKATPPSKPEATAAKSVGQQRAANQTKPLPRVATANKKPNEPAQTGAASKTNVTAAKIAVKAPEQNQAKVETAGGKQEDTPKQPDNIKKVEDSKESDVVVLIDDDDDVPVEKQTAPNPPAAGKIPVVSTPDTAKPQRAQKRNANALQAQESGDKPSNVKQGSVQDDKPLGTDGNKGDTTTATVSKKVINPAALLAKTAEKNSDNVPRYQQNRVIIPTVDKTKKKPSPVVSKQAVVTAAPNFSTKKFSMSNELEGIIGVEYVVKILKVYNDPEPFYECCLCEVVMDGVGMQTHLLGYNHRYKYIEKHFPTCFNQYKDHIGNIQVMGIILDRVARAIEDHHGRELPYECLSGEFRSNRHGVMTTVYSFRHASEYSGPSFTNVVDNKQIDEMYKKKQMYHPPKPDPKRKPTFDTRSGAPETKRSKVDRRGNILSNNNRGTNGGSSRRPYRDEIETNVMDDAVHKQMVEEFLQNTRGRSRSPGGGRRRRHRSRTRSRSPHRSSRRRAAARRSLSPLREGDVWQAYRHLVDRSKTELDQLYLDYRKDPEKHPLYDEEWRKFWKHRKEQMSREGLDHRNYDFQPEWVRYFAVRIEELYDEAVEDIKVSSRRRLILPMTNDELEDKRYHVKAPIEEEPAEDIPKPMLQYPQVVDNKPSVVSVLRLLTALEDYLGSLGPRVVDLLSKALLMEKTHPREINQIVLTLENCTVLETAMEKLKGVLIAGLLEGPKVRAFNNVIMETEKILKFAYKIRQRNPQPVPQPVPAPKNHQEFQKSSWSQGGSTFMPSPQLNSVGVASAGTTGAAASLLSQIDKKELASKLAAALTAQGKTDFNPEQLQQLIAVYSLIDKKKRDSAAAADKQKMTLSDTLTALLAPTEKSGDVGTGVMPSSGRGNYSNSNIDRMGDRPGPLSNSSINSFVSMLNRDSSSTGGSGADSQMWQNLQNIQNSLRTQNTMGVSSNTGGYGSGSMGRIGGGGGGGGGSGYMGNMDNMPSGGNFNRGGFGGGSSTGGGGTGGGGTGGGFNLAQNSSLNFNRSGPSGGDSAGYGSNFQSMSGNNSGGFSRGGGGGDDMLGGGRGGGGQGGGGRGMGGNFSSGGMGGGMNSLSRGGGGGGGPGASGSGNMGGGSNSGFSRSGGDNFLGGSGSNNSGGNSGGFGGNLSSGLNNYPAGGGGGNNNYQRGSGGMGGGSNSALGLSMSSAPGGGTFSRGGGGGGNSMNNNFNNLLTNKNAARNDGGGSSFASNQRNMGGGNDIGGSSFGSNQRNMGGNDGGSLGFGSNQRNIGGNQPNRGGGGGGNMLMGSNSNNSQSHGGNRGGGSNWRNQ